MIHARRNPSRKSILIKLIPGSADPGLLPSSTMIMEPSSQRSSCSSMSEAGSPHSDASSRHSIKIDQLFKVNEAISVELEDLECGKERWLEKLKLIEGRICSNMVQIDKWAAESKTKPGKIEVLDMSFETDTKVKEGFFSDVPFGRHLSLADLASVFKSYRGKRGNKSFHRPGNNLSYNMDLYLKGHEGSAKISKEGSPICSGSNTSSLEEGVIGIPESPSKERNLSQELVKISDSRRIVSKMGSVQANERKTDNLEVDNDLLQAEDVLHAEFSEFVSSEARRNLNIEDKLAQSGRNNSSARLETASKVDVEGDAKKETIGGPQEMTGGEYAAVNMHRRHSLLGSRATLSNDLVVSSEGDASSRGARRNSNIEDELAQSGRSSSSARLGTASKVDVEGNARKETTGSPQDVTVAEEMTGGEYAEVDMHTSREGRHSLLGSHTTLSSDIVQANIKLRQLKQQIVVIQGEKQSLKDALKQCEDSLQKAKLDTDKLKLQIEEFQGMLAYNQHALEGSRSDADTLRSENMRLQALLTDCQKRADSLNDALEKQKDHREKLLCRMESLKEAEHRVLVLERQSFVLSSELNYFKDALERTKQDVLVIEKKKGEVMLELSSCKQTLTEAQNSATLLLEERDNRTRECSEHKQNLARNQVQLITLEKENKKLHDSLADSRHALEKAAERHSSIEKERGELDEAYKDLIIKYKESQKHAFTLENEKSELETVLTHFKHALEETQQQVADLVEEKDYMESEFHEVKEALEEEKQHTVSLEEEKIALEARSCQYKDVIKETEQHVSTLQSALEGTLQRADALDHQIQRLRMEVKRLNEENESLHSFKCQQEAMCRDLEAQRHMLSSELESVQSKQQASVEALEKINSMYVSNVEELEKEKYHNQCLQHEKLLLEKDNADLKASLEKASQMHDAFEAEQKRIHGNLTETNCSLLRAIQELEALTVEHGNEAGALRIENAARECQMEGLMEQMQQKVAELERFSKLEGSFNQLSENFNAQESELKSVRDELKSVKLELAAKQIELEDERSAKEKSRQELIESAAAVERLKKDFYCVTSEREGLREAMQKEMVIKRQMMQRLHAECAHSKELEALLEQKQNDMFVHVEEERMEKEAALEELEAMKVHNEEIERDLCKLQAEVHMWEKVNDEKESILQVLHEEQFKSKELQEVLHLRGIEQESANRQREDERDAYECLLRELEQERRQRLQIEELLKLSITKEEEMVSALQAGREECVSLKKQIEEEELRYNELKTVLDSAKKEHETLEQEATSRRTVVQEPEDPEKHLSHQQHCNVTGNEKGIYLNPEWEGLKRDVSELLAKSRKLEEMLNILARDGMGGGSDDPICSVLSQEVKKLQLRVEGIGLQLNEAGYIINEKGESEPAHDVIDEGKDKETVNEKENENDPSPLLDGRSAFGSTDPELELLNIQDSGGKSIINIAQQAEEEIKRMKESTEMLHANLFDAHHNVIYDAASVLAELKSIRRHLNDMVTIDGGRKEEKKRATLFIPTAALSTSALAAVGILAFLKNMNKLHPLV
ncbi:hypothetical protein KP509_26G071600 [Ceratopteris richardii]|nr:hypothetical protein KP509_26G071600 [Ceratopteris richardii]